MPVDKVQCIAMLFYAMPCCAVSCFAVLSYFVPHCCTPVFCYAMTCNTMTCNATPCSGVVLCFGIWCSTMFWLAETYRTFIVSNFDPFLDSSNTLPTYTKWRWWDFSAAVPDKMLPTCVRILLPGQTVRTTSAIKRWRSWQMMKLNCMGIQRALT